jgi:hypothetical protein
VFIINLPVLGAYAPKQFFSVGNKIACVTNQCSQYQFLAIVVCIDLITAFALHDIIATLSCLLENILQALLREDLCA